MVMEGNDEVASGWPLGLGSIRAAAVPPLPNTLHRLRSFSSFSSSNLDTESTGSFFPDQSVSLGKLIGIGPVKEREACAVNNIGQCLMRGPIQWCTRSRTSGRGSVLHCSIM